MAANLIFVAAIAATGGLFAWSFCEHRFTRTGGGPWGIYPLPNSSAAKFYLAIVLSLVESAIALWWSLA